MSGHRRLLEEQNAMGSNPDGHMSCQFCNDVLPHRGQAHTNDIKHDIQFSKLQKISLNKLIAF